MRGQPQRDEKTLVIAMALAVFLGTVLIGVAVGVVGAVSGVWDFDAASNSAALVAVVAGTLYLARRRRP